METKNKVLTLGDLDVDNIAVVNVKNDMVYHLSIFDVLGVSCETDEENQKDYYLLYFKRSFDEENQKIIIDTNTAYFLAMVIQFIKMTVKLESDGKDDDLS